MLSHCIASTVRNKRLPAVEKMSDTKFAVVAQRFRKIDKIDDAWLKDSLSDDGWVLYQIVMFIDNVFFSCCSLEIELPKGVPAPTPHEEIDVAEEKAKSNDDWSDLRLDSFLKE